MVSYVGITVSIICLLITVAILVKMRLARDIDHYASATIVKWRKCGVLNLILAHNFCCMQKTTFNGNACLRSHQLELGIASWTDHFHCWTGVCQLHTSTLPVSLSVCSSFCPFSVLCFVFHYKCWKHPCPACYQSMFCSAYTVFSSKQ